MGAIVSKKNTDYINNNWNELKCSPIGPLLQMIGIAPGNSSETSNQCKSAEFSSQFSSSIKEHVNMTSTLNKGVNAITGTINSIRTAISSMEQRAFQDLASIATQIFSIYVKIGNIFYIIVKNLMNIMNIFKQSINFGASTARLLISFIDLLEIPVNMIISIITFFTRG